jgi:8-oxo-dGTP diphosphatase
MPRRAGGLKPTIRVVAALIYDSQGRVLITERPAGKTLAGCWEFPGGKVEQGESGEAALRRELLEELGVRVSALRWVLELGHEYPERHVQLSVWAVDAYRGVPTGLEGQNLRWEAVAALRSVALLPADLPIVEWLERST